MLIKTGIPPIYGIVFIARLIWYLFNIFTFLIKTIIIFTLLFYNIFVHEPRLRICML